MADALDQDEQVVEGFAGFNHLGGTGGDLSIDVVHLFHRTVHIILQTQQEITDLLIGFLGLLGQLADFSGDDGKSPSMLTCAGRFNGSIQRQHLNLFGNLSNTLDDLSDHL
ncbi:hypothetical protein D3C73_798370 [compost metagenome]